ncbi:23S rRNA (pseudouridine(1915)-N(3))-methyltransferase RlmH [Sporomusa sp.]|uniref:23S rRNA (pseudouridine(1915)-N(3))-methyltransferase RlmH n=1 Tax=Sporomusa sp. TaxID=2078658 RepID=UPI002C460292|nr:23S rRNA (pseudouridine(1915)-N(3))-methyltransferase RlmH [Sporomusa sp.]HWR08557.1 23S rRNA (pseudouridine(1915)-N(3))-methyltransferase RlmH [Sporomusa sp.]
MKITILAIGKIKEKYLTAGIQEFLKRLTPFCKLDILELAEERMPDNPSPAEKTQALTREGERILKAVRQGSYLIVLDVAGQALSSEQLAAKFDSLALSGNSDITFVIGGAFGLSAELVAAGKERLSFSKMTFTHQMIRLLLVEQVYRAFKISRGEPYHW